MTTDTTALTLAEMWETLEDLGVSEQALQLITDINGYNETTMCAALFWKTGYRTFNQLEEELEKE